METNNLLKAIFNELLKEIHDNKDLQQRITHLIKEQVGEVDKRPKKRRRRKLGPFDPMTIHRNQPQELEPRLSALEIDELKDIIAEHGMDRSKLAMRWKAKERLIDLIMTTVKSRSQKGDAFRGTSDNKG